MPNPKKKAQVKSQFTPFEVGQVKAHVYHGLSGAEISRIILKPDGTNKWSDKAVQDVVARLNDDPSWRGERAQGSGAPRKTTRQQDVMLEKCVAAKKAQFKVTVPYLKKVFPWAREFSDSLVEDRLHEAGLAYLRRRKKAVVTYQYLRPRINYRRSTLKRVSVTCVMGSWTRSLKV